MEEDENRRLRNLGIGRELTESEQTPMLFTPKTRGLHMNSGYSSVSPSESCSIQRSRPDDGLINKYSGADRPISWSQGPSRQATSSIHTILVENEAKSECKRNL